MKLHYFLLLFLFTLNLHATDYYVTTSGNNKNDGKSEKKAWRTLGYAAAKASPGDNIYIKAGNYGNENVLIRKSGTSSKYISFIGYVKKPGDIKSLYYKYSKGKSLNSKEMPLFDGKNGGKGTGIEIKASYVRFENIQVTNYNTLIDVRSGSNLYFENVLAHTAGGTKGQSGPQGTGLIVANDASKKVTVKNSTFVDASRRNMVINGSNHTIIGCKFYNDRNDTSYGESTDYHLRVTGHSNVIRNCYVERVGKPKHGAHGISLKGNDMKTYNNLIEDCTIKNVRGALEFRHSQVKNNTARGVTILGPEGRIVFRDGASNNLVENSLVKGTEEGIRFLDSSEDGKGGTMASDNTVRNTVFENVDQLIVSTFLDGGSSSAKTQNNTVVNCTFVNIHAIYNARIPMSSNNEIVNSIFCNVKLIDHQYAKNKTKWNLSYVNFDKKGFKSISGSNLKYLDPEFVDAAKGNFRLKKTSRMIDAGKKISGISKDKEGNKRPNGSSFDLGAYEYNGKSSGGTQPSSPPSSSDEEAFTKGTIEICPKETIILEASSGDKYNWNSGERSRRIEVSPSQSSIYKVTVTKNGEKSKERFTVNVNSNGKCSKDTESTEPASSNGESFTKGTIEICPKETIILEASSGDKYYWSTGERSKSIKVSPSESSVYKVTVTKNGVKTKEKFIVDVKSKGKCSEGTQSTKPKEPTGDVDIESIIMYPNPSSGIVNFAYEGKELVTIRITDDKSNVKHKSKVDFRKTDIATFDFGSFKKGTYYVRCLNDRDRVNLKLVIK